MKVHHRVAIGACAIALLLACGGGGSGGSGSTPASSSGVTQYKQLSLQVQSAANGYAQTMTASGVTTVAACQTAEDQYDAQVRPWISQMVQMSGGMDDLTSMHGGSMEADMGCDANAMMQELDHHRAIACASSDLATDRSEATRHVQAMTGYAAHAIDRCDQALTGMSGGGWSWSPMMSGCQMTSGGGGMMPGGRGMM